MAVAMARSLFVVLFLGASSTLGACILSRSGTETDGGSPGPSGGGGQDTTTTTTGGGGSGGDPSGPATTTTGGGGQGGGNGVESDCTNGSDDDGDQATDCDDSDCIGAGYTCLAPSPGALGHLVFAPSCPADSVPKALRYCDAGACSCTPANGTCSVSVSRWNGIGCVNNPVVTVTNDYTCKNPADGDSSFLGSSTPDGNGACNAQPATVPSIPTDGCEVDGGSCTGGGACVGPGFPIQTVCVAMSGNTACTAPYDGFRAVVYDSSSSTCACACNKSSETCDAFWSWVAIHNGTDDCSDGVIDWAPLDGNCQPFGYTESYQLYPVAALVECGAPTATMAATELTICCTQQPS
jgi:hypothetical protein